MKQQKACSDKMQAYKAGEILHHNCNVVHLWKTMIRIRWRDRIFSSLMNRMINYDF